MKQKIAELIQEFTSEHVLHYGLSIQDIAKLLQNLIDQMELSIPPSRILVDVGYLYKWDLSDLPYIKKENDAIKDGYVWVVNPDGKTATLRNPLQVAWHEKLERWMNDQTVIIQGRQIKPLQLERSFDKVPNEAMGLFASALVGEDDIGNFFFASIGDGGLGTQPTPGDTTLIHEIDRINANESPNGGSSTVDGTTFQIVANYSKAIESFDASESGVHDTAQPTTDKLLDHTIFSKAVSHSKDNDAPGTTSTVFQCST